MPSNLTLTSATFNTTTPKFGQSINGGYGVTSGNFASTANTFTVEFWTKSAAQSGTQVAVGSNQSFWIGAVNNNLQARYGVGDIGLVTSSNINDGAWHHVALSVGAGGGKLFLDGVSVANISTISNINNSNPLGVRVFGGQLSFIWPGEIDECAVWSTDRYTANFTPPTAPYIGNETGLVSLYHLNGDGVDSQGASAPAATAVAMTGPTSGTTGVASSAFMVGANGTITGTVVVTPSDGGAGGSFAPSTVSISSGTPSATFTYTPASVGAKTISATNNGSLTNPSSITYTAASAASTVSSVTVAPATATVAGGGTQAFAATVNGTNSPAQGVNWTANAGSINSSGVFTAPASTGSAQSVTVTATSTQDGTKSGTATVTVPAVTSNNALTNGTANVLFSPYTWNIGASSAKTINAGAYFKTIFTGTSCTLQFDISANGNPMTQISYRVDGYGAWVTVPLAASVAISMPSDTSDYASKGGHLLEVLVKSTSEGLNRWSPQATACVLTGIILATGGTLAKPPALPLNCLFYGDSITEGVRTVNGSATNDTDRNDAGQSWATIAARILAAEVGVVGFGFHGFTHTGSGGVPVFPSSYNLLYSGVARSFATAPDFICIMEGTNDSSDVTTAATTVLNGLIAATPGTTKIIVLRPFNGATRAAELQAAIAACTTPSRCYYVDTAGFFTSANSSDGLHPYGNENITHIAPQVATAIRAILAGTPTLTSRTVSLTLGDTNGAAANLTGLKVAFHDEASPDLFTTARYKSATQTTSASGVLTFTVNSTLPSGGTGHVSVLGASAVHFNGPVVVA